jgi:putative oxygen-independent coproporphyrinogen III oxidase
MPHARRSEPAAGLPDVPALGVYVHVPFCAARCGYCDFATWTDKAHLVDAYVDAVVADYHRHRKGGAGPAGTVFFGGGTPSMLPADRLVRILDAIDRAPGAEVTVECNPDSVDERKLAAYRAAGVTRLSFGVQSMAPHVLAALDRTHDPRNVVTAARLARDLGFPTWSVDLIYGTPGESDRDWRATIDTVLALGAPHVSAYALSVEAGTPLGRAVAAGSAAAPDDDVQAARYEAADAMLGAGGLDWYEISSWARPGHECRHNLGYWHGADVLALGCAAHGVTGGRRWWTVRSPERYIERIRTGRSAEAGAERLPAPAAAEERFALALRTRSGAPVAPPACGEADRLAGAGLLAAAGERYVLTRAGRLVATDVTARLLLAGAAPGSDGSGAAPAGLALGTIEC